MAESTDSVNKDFAALVRAAAPVEDLTSGKRALVRGPLYRSGDGAFAIVTDGQILELPIAAVDRFKVTGSGVHPEVELSLSSEALSAARKIGLKPIFSETIFAADHKNLHKDLATDPIADHKQPIKDIITDPIADQTLYAADHKHLPKDLAKDPITDPVGTGFADPIGGTLAEQTGIDPSQGTINPAAGLTPFVMATPHQAPSPMVNLQASLGQQRLAGSAQLKAAQFDTLKEMSNDNTLKEVIHDTHKELIFDTAKELIVDTHKEVFETQVEGGGTWQEGGQIPGGFPGMPGF